MKPAAATSFTAALGDELNDRLTGRFERAYGLSVRDFGECRTPRCSAPGGLVRRFCGVSTAGPLLALRHQLS